MNNARRRMVQKFSNRPPFDLKSNKESTPIGKNFKKSFEHVEKSYRSIMTDLDAIDDDDFVDPFEAGALLDATQNKTKPSMDTAMKNPVPKVLDTFQKPIPKNRQTVATKNNARKTIISKSELKGKKPLPSKSCANDDQFALKTLYRNKNIEFGKNGVKLKITKNLLHNYEEPMEEVSPVDLRCSTLSLKRSTTVIKRTTQSTSTTDLPCEERGKPAFDDSRLRPWKKPTYKLKQTQKSKSKTPPTGISRETSSKQRTYKEGPFAERKIISLPSDSSNIDLGHKSYVSSHGKLNNSQTDNLHNKSFVKNGDSTKQKMGIKKFNKGQKTKTSSKTKINSAISKNYMGIVNTAKNKNQKFEMNNEIITGSKISLPSDSSNYDVNFVEEDKSYVLNNLKSFVKNCDMKQSYNNGIRKLNKVQKTKSNSKTRVSNGINKNYMGMINTVKNKYPKLEANNEPVAVDNTANDWSDDAADPDVTQSVRFPKETRNAMERLMESSKSCKPLTTFMRGKDQSKLQPAVPLKRVDVSSSDKIPTYARRAPYTICGKLESIPDSREIGHIGDHIENRLSSGKVAFKGRPNSRARKVQKPRGLR